MIVQLRRLMNKYVCIQVRLISMGSTLWLLNTMITYNKTIRVNYNNNKWVDS